MSPFNGSKICLDPKLSSRTAIMIISPVRTATNRRFANESTLVRCMTSATWFQDARMKSILPTLNISAQSVGNIFHLTSPIWPRPAVTTPIGLSPSRLVWWSKMACLIAPPVGLSGATIASSSPLPPFRIGWRQREKKISPRVETDYLDWALTDFSGYLTADELYDGPFCILSIVDNHTFKRLFFQVLEHTPNQVDILAFFSRFQAVLVARDLAVKGITTDGSDLYPSTIRAVWGEVPHQICQFHILANLNEAVLHAVAKVRKTLTARKPPARRGRPTKDTRKVIQQRQRLEQKISDLFTYRYLFVRHHLTESEQETLQRITRGLPHLRILRQIMDEVYRLFDRRCRTQTALVKLFRLRQRVQRFTSVGKTLQVLFSANVEKALTFLDDRLLPATSNAVERGNRRYRKMQKTIYRVRTYLQIVGRIALDMWREAFAQNRTDTLQWLHQARSALKPLFTL